ncbi:acetylcholine receptor subunit alpha-L1-like [Tubulanus polymorphus]|uniref:acetylcholine receptor subunit alpha-L1-like n=1 Tax=Tubulanus polymorphus TaxID=672921 RepID=UPI003DA20680
MAVTTVGLLILLSCFVSVESMNPEAKLIKAIKDGYEKAGKIARPVKQPNETMKVDVGLALIHINEINHKLSALSLNAWLRMSWKDEFLKWDPAEFGGITEIRIPIHYIWKPDVVLYNKAYINGYGGMMITDDTMAVVSHSGEVLWIPPVLIVSLCPGNQGETTSCALKFGSWTYDGFLLDVNFFDNQKAIDLTDYVFHNRYEIMKTSAIKNTKYYPCCKEPYPDLTFYLTFKNREKDNKP